MEVGTDSTTPGDGLVQTTAPSTEAAAPTAKPDGVDQDTFNKIVAREKAEAQRNERKRILEEAGVPTLEQLRSVVKAHSEAQDAAKSEVQRAVDAANAEMEAARQERQAVAYERHTLNVEKALAAAGARDHLSDLAKLVDAEVGADPLAVEAAVEAVKAKFGAMFGYATPPSSEPSGGASPPRTSPPSDALSRGASRAEAYNNGTHIPNF